MKYINLKELERKAFSFYHQDGLLDMVFLQNYSKSRGDDHGY
jgi:hypothetical protein